MHSFDTWLVFFLVTEFALVLVMTYSNIYNYSHRDENLSCLTSDMVIAVCSVSYPDILVNGYLLVTFSYY